MMAPDVMPISEKISPWVRESRPEGNGLPTVRAMRASRSRSCTWFSADAPQESSITPASISSPFAQGKRAPSGALSMKPAAAETSTSSTIPSLDSSAYAPNLAVASTVARPTPRAVPGSGGDGRSSPEALEVIDACTEASALRRTRDLYRSSTPHGRLGERVSPAARASAGPDEQAPERVADGGVERSNRRIELGQHGDDTEGHL